MFSYNSKSITQVIFVTDIIFDVMTINIQIDRSFFKERHLRTNMLNSCTFAWGRLYLAAWGPNRNKISFQRVQDAVLKLSSLGHKGSLLLSKPGSEWNILRGRFFFFSLYNVVILVFYEYVNIEMFAPSCMGNHSKWPVTLSKKQKEGGQ